MIIPSIDLANGKVVQLRQGKEKAIERNTPLELAKEFNRYGEIAIIDLDAAMNKGNNLKIIKKILQVADGRVGGGVRNVTRAKTLLALGASKVIIGSAAFENDSINHKFLSRLSFNIGSNRIIIATDIVNGEIVTQGWTHKTGISIFDAIKKTEKYTKEFLFTCVEREGMMTGINMEMVHKIRGLTNNRITVAGGICSIKELQEISRLEMNAQLGMAIYTGKLNLTEAFIESLNWKQELIPTIVRDISGQVLMLAYSNRESIRRTFLTNKMWYYSRSRKKLWMKGETSGNTQRFINYRTDCDFDALLATVEQKGVACHLGTFSCFGNKKL